MNVDRLSNGYQPDFDIDMAVGRQGELFCTNIVEGITEGSIEVKTDERALQTGRVYIEHACLRRGEWQPSGIATTKAEFWAFVLGRRVLVAMPVADLRRVHAQALAWGKLAETSRGSHPTKGALLPLNTLLLRLLDLAG